MKIARFFIAAWCAFSAYGGTIDFENSGDFTTPLGGSVVIEGFTFYVPGYSQYSYIGPITPGSCTCVSDGTTTLGVFNGTAVTISPVSGNPFSLTSFDLAGVLTAPTDRNVTSFEVIGNLAGGGMVGDTITPVDPSTFTTYTLPSDFTNLSSVEFLGLRQVNSTAGGGPQFQLDNIVYIAGAPEPVSSVLMLAGLGGLVARARMSQRKREQTLA